MQCDYCNVTVQPSKLHEHFCALHPSQAYNRYLEDLVTALRETVDRFSLVLSNVPSFKYTIKKNLLMIHLDFQRAPSEETMGPVAEIEDGHSTAQSDHGEKTMCTAGAAQMDSAQSDKGEPGEQTMCSVGTAGAARVMHSAQSEGEPGEQTMCSVGAVCFMQYAQSEQTIGPVGSVAFDSSEKQSVPRIPKRLGDYDRLQFIGQGSFGKCFEVVERSTGNRFACKILKKSTTRSHEAMIFNEINIHCKLKDEHVVAFIESFEDDIFVYIIQTFCSHSLWDFANQLGILTLEECAYFISQTVKGLEYIHWKGYIHRDIKPSNILIDQNKQTKVADFGLAIHPKNVRPGEICGTANYLSPECVNGEGSSFACDIWAVGVTAFFLLLGYRPFNEDNINDKGKIYNRIIKMDYR